MLPAKVAGVISRDGTSTTNRDGMAIAENMTPAVLTNYERLAVRGTVFPALELSTSSEHTVEGLVIFGLTHAQRNWIEWYEANLYKLESVKVEMKLAPEGRRTVDADTYVWARPRSELLDADVSAWSIEECLPYYANEL